MTNDQKLKKINIAINNLILKGNVITIINIADEIGITTQAFYLTYKYQLDYVNTTIYTKRVESVELKIKKIKPNYKLIELSSLSNNAGKHLIQCDNENHEPFYSNIYNNKLVCPTCRDEAKNNKGLLKANEIAKSKGGVCLSTEYKNQLSKLTFHCGNERHNPWTTTFLNILYNKTWCPECGRSQLNKKKG